ncbi:MAG: aerial mycelium formation protein, partial [Actinobacteria bacterium]|nr:aerial mycelium formation protein [Actinomycetota bacterium]
MAEKQRRLVDRLVDPSYIADLTGKAVEELKEMRSEAREGEGEISFERRLAQARIDILTAELERR